MLFIFHVHVRDQARIISYISLDAKNEIYEGVSCKGDS